MKRILRVTDKETKEQYDFDFNKVSKQEYRHEIYGDTVFLIIETLNDNRKFMADKVSLEYIEIKGDWYGQKDKLIKTGNFRTSKKYIKRFLYKAFTGNGGCF